VQKVTKNVKNAFPYQNAWNFPKNDVFSKIFGSGVKNGLGPKVSPNNFW
jgi:hypothetical protein